MVHLLIRGRIAQMDPRVHSHVLRHRREPDSRTARADLPLNAQISAAKHHRAPNNLVVHIHDVVIANQLIHRAMLRLREPIRLNHQRRRTHTRQINSHRPSRGGLSRSRSRGLSRSGRSLLSRSGSRIGLSLSGGGLSLSRFQGRLQFGDDLGVYGSLGFRQGRVESSLGLGRGGRSLLGPSGSRIGLGLSRGSIGLSLSRLGLSRGRGSLSRGGVGVRNAIVVIVAACRGHQPEGQQHRDEVHPGSLPHFCASSYRVYRRIGPNAARPGDPT